MINMRKVSDEDVNNNIAQLNYLIGKNDLFLLAGRQDTIMLSDSVFKLQNISYPYLIPQYFKERAKIHILKPGPFKQYISMYLKINEDYIIMTVRKKTFNLFSCRVVEYNGHYFYIACDLKESENDYMKEMSLSEANDTRVREDGAAYVEINMFKQLFVKVLRSDIDSPVLYNKDANLHNNLEFIYVIKYGIENSINEYNEYNDTKVIRFIDDSYESFEPLSYIGPVYKKHKFKYLEQVINTELIDKYVKEIPMRIDDLEYLDKSKEKVLKPKKD